MPDALRVRHRSAGPSTYDWEAPSYDAFNEARSRGINRTIEGILRRHGARRVLDLACGTGSQVFWLARRGFEVTGCDISRAMLSRARRKAHAGKVPVRLMIGDMRTARVGRFDAVLTISNAVGHLARRDFAKAMRTIRGNLNPGGVYVFDIFNRDYFDRADRISELTIDWTTIVRGSPFRQVQHSTLDRRGVLTSHTTCMSRGRATRGAQTLQIYGARELASMLRASAFRRVRFLGVDGAAFSSRASLRLLAIARA